MVPVCGTLDLVQGELQEERFALVRRICNTMVDGRLLPFDGNLLLIVVAVVVAAVAAAVDFFFVVAAAAAADWGGLATDFNSTSQKCLILPPESD